MVVGSRLSEGATMYSGVWDTLSPFSAGFYWIMYSIFGNSNLIFQILSVLLVFIHSAIFNTIMINKGVFKDNNYIPAIVYVVLASLYFDFFTVSPVMLGLTFILLALNNIFGQIEIRAKRDEKLLSTGLYFGIATLFHFPFFIFGITILVVFILFTATVRRRYFLYLFGFLLPMIMTALYYYFIDSLGLYWQNHILAWFTIETKVYLTNALAFAIIGFVVFFLILSFWRIFWRARLTNYQNRLNQAVFFIMTMSAAILFIEIDRNAYVFLAFVPTSAFFISHYFTLAKKGFVSEIVFMVFIIAAGTFNFKSISDSSKEGIFNIQPYFVMPNEGNKSWDNSNICWLGDNLEVYQNSYAATPFVNWRLSAKVWENSKRYQYLTLITNSIEKDKPDVIIDPDGFMINFLKQAPGLSEAYEKDGQLYFRKD